MAKLGYGIGDSVILTEGPVRTGRAEGEFIIVAVLPDMGGSTQFRVKSKSENFERRIVGSDIDLERSPKPLGDRKLSAETEGPGGSWLKSSTIKIGR